MPERDIDDPLEPGPADPEELEDEELELDDPVIDEAALPSLDTDDPEAGASEAGYEDLLDHHWLERGSEDDLDDERTALDDIGLTIDLDSARDEDDGAQVVDLDVGSLLTSLPSEGTELDLEPGPLLERGDATLGVGVLRDVLLPEDDDDERDDREVGDDERFPVFDDAERQPRGSDDDSEIGPDDLS